MIPIFDNGHGGLINGIYHCIAGGRKVIYDFGTIYEGEFNRAIVNRLIELCQLNGIPYFNLVPELIDIPLYERGRRANKIVSDVGKHNCYVLSIHSNASESGIPHGCEGFIYPNSQLSPSIANEFSHSIIYEFGGLEWRYGHGKLYKERNFAILRIPKCAAFLLELFFMNNPKEVKDLLLTKIGRDRIAKSIFSAIKHLYFYGA